ncbi:lysR substrate binding domain-containing protein [Ditylenchus destructor]|uniref:LysR substrate binding domain-containing protein n=1 Tax=Ditylenchus destructor TaxID=166010 RepID=A0AAD4MID7_9BILA|nr:lysR substrate binding domain-containing protein [Ditylenchus destructor]
MTFDLHPTRRLQRHRFRREARASGRRAQHHPARTEPHDPQAGRTAGRRCSSATRRDAAHRRGPRAAAACAAAAARIGAREREHQGHARAGEGHDPCRRGRQHRLPRAAFGHRPDLQQVAQPSGPDHRRRLGPGWRTRSSRTRSTWPRVDTEDTAEIVAVKDCRWEDTSYVVAGRHHPLRKKRKLKLSDTLGERWAILPKGTGPFEHMKSVFARQNLALPNVVVETRSVMALKSLIGHSGFLGWMPAPIVRRRAKGRADRCARHSGRERQENADRLRRRSGMLPGPSVKLLEELRALTAA